MNPKISSSVASLLVISGLLLFAFFRLGVSRVEKGIMTIGGIRDITESAQNGVEIENLARFAIEEHNKKENSFLEFARLVKAKEQIVSGMMYYLTLEVTDAAGKIKVYETKIWVKPWMNFKEVQEFKVSNDPSSRNW